MPARKVKAKGGRGGTKTTPAEGGSLWDDVKEAWSNDKAKSTNAQLARIDAAAKGGDFMDFFPVLKAMGAGLKKKTSAKGGDFWDDVKAIYVPVKAEPVKAEPVKAELIGAGLKKTTAKGRKKKELIAHEVLLKELAKVKTPVKSQRKANKKQDVLDIRDFVSKSKPKDQVTQLLEGIRIKRALDAQYKKLSDKADERLKQDIIDKTSKSKDREVSERIKAEDLKAITDKQDADKQRRDRIADAQKERRQLLLEAGREQRRELAQDQRQRDIEDREEVKYQQRQMLRDIRPRGRPTGAYNTLGAIEDDEGNYDATYSSVSKDDLMREAKELGVSTKGGKEEIARRIINKKSGKEEATELIEGLETLANMEHRPKVMITPDLLGGVKLKGADDEGVLTKVASPPTAPAKPRPVGAPPTDLLASLKSGKKLKKTTSGLLDTTAADTAEKALKAEQAEALAEVSNRKQPSRANKSYKLETVDGMIAELTHRGIPIPQRSKLAYVKGNPIQQEITLSDYKQLLFAEMKK